MAETEPHESMEVHRERQRVRLGKKENKTKRENYKLIKRDRKEERNRDGELGRGVVVEGCREQQISRKTEQHPEGLQVVN